MACFGWDGWIDTQLWVSILNFRCENASEVPLKELRSGQDLDPLSWQEKFCPNYIYSVWSALIFIIYILSFYHLHFYHLHLKNYRWSDPSPGSCASFFLRLVLAYVPCFRRGVWGGMMKKYLLLKKNQLKTRVQESIPNLLPKRLKLMPYLWPKPLGNQSLWGRTYLCSPYEGPYKGVPLLFYTDKPKQPRSFPV